MAQSTRLLSTPVVIPASSSSPRKSSISLPVLKSTFQRLKVKVNVQSSRNVNIPKIAVKDDLVVDHFIKGRFVDDSLVFRQNFNIRSYEAGPDGTASVETVMNICQEAALNHAIGTSMGGGGFTSTREMCKRNLCWVVAKSQLHFDHYTAWCDVIEVDTWIAVSGKNGVRRDWLARDSNTGDIFARGSSELVIMNTKTRKLARLPAEVREEMDCFFANLAPVLDTDGKKLLKLDTNSANSVCTSFTPRWNDLDPNQHINSVKYVNWIIESVPLKILKTHKLVALTLEYRRECVIDNVVQSFATIVNNDTTDSDFTEFQHLLCLEDGSESVRGMTKWKCM